MKILVPEIRYRPSGCLTALVRADPTSDPACGSVRHIVPAHLPPIQPRQVQRFLFLRTKLLNHLSDPIDRPGYIANDVAPATSSSTAIPSSVGAPDPPTLDGSTPAAAPSHRPASTHPESLPAF